MRPRRWDLEGPKDLVQSRQSVYDLAKRPRHPHRHRSEELVQFLLLLAPAGTACSAQCQAPLGPVRPDRKLFQPVGQFLRYLAHVDGLARLDRSIHCGCVHCAPSLSWEYVKATACARTVRPSGHGLTARMPT
jgi:hypothetical protein